MEDDTDADMGPRISEVTEEEEQQQRPPPQAYVSEWDSDSDDLAARQPPQDDYGYNPQGYAYGGGGGVPQQQQEETIEVPPGMLSETQEYALRVRTSAAHQMAEVEAYRKQHCHYWRYFDGFETAYRRDHLQNTYNHFLQVRARAGTHWLTRAHRCCRRCPNATRINSQRGAARR